MKKFVSWIGGIVATVIAGVLVYYWTTPTPPPPEIAFEGMVIDAERDVAVQNALVSFDVSGASPSDAYHDLTDEHGSYGIKLSDLSKSTVVTLHVHANGYRDESRQFASLSDDNRYDPLLTPLPGARPVAHVGVTPTPTPRPLAHPELPYIKKLTVPTFRVTQLGKK